MTMSKSMLHVCLVVTSRCSAVVAIWLTATLAVAERPELVMMTAHSGTVNSLEFSQDGQQLLSSSSDNTALLWDVSSGNRLRTFHTEHPNVLWNALFTPSERQLLTVSTDRVSLWDAPTGTHIRSFTDNIEYRHIYSAAITVDGARLLTAGSNLQLWDIATGELIRRVDELNSGLCNIAISPDGIHFALGGGYSTSNAVQIWNVDSMSLVRSLSGHEDDVASIAFNHDGTRLLSGSEDRTAILWNPISGTRLHRITEHTHHVTNVCFNGDGTRYCTSQGRMGQLSIIWDANTHEKLTTIANAAIAVFIPNEDQLAVGAWEGVSIHDARSGQKIRQLGASRATLNALDLSANGRRAVVVAGSRTMIGLGGATQWDMDTCRPVSHVDSNATCAVYTRDGKRIACSLYDEESRTSSIVIRDAVTNDRLYEVSLGQVYVSKMEFGRDGRNIAVLPMFAPPFLVDIESGMIEHTFDGHRTFIKQAIFTPDDRRVVTLGRMTGEIAITDPHTGEVTRRINNSSTSHFYQCIAISSNGSTIAAGGVQYDKSGGHHLVTLWDVRTGDKLQTLDGHRASIKSVAFFPDNKRLLSVSEVGTFKVWDTSTGQLVLTSLQPGKNVNVVAVRPDGEVFVGGCEDGKLLVFDANTGQVLQQPEVDTGAIRFLQFDASGNQLLAGKLLLDARSFKELRRIGEHGYPTAFSDDGQKVLTQIHRTEGLVAELWDAATGAKIASFAPQESYYQCAAFSHDGTKILMEGTLWNTDTRDKIREFRPHSGKVSALSFSVDGNRLVSAGQEDKSAIIWDRNTGQPTQVISTGEHPYFADISPDGTTFLAPIQPDYQRAGEIGMYGTVALFDAMTGERKREFFVHKSNNVMLGQFDPSGKYFLTAAEGEPIVAWETASGRRVQEFVGHEGRITDIKVGPHGRRLFTASWDGTLRVWDFTNGRELVQILFINDGNEWLAVTPEGYFDGSFKGREMVAWKVGNEMFPLEQYEQRFHRPDLVARSLQGRSLDSEATLSSQQIPPSVLLTIEETQDNFAIVRAEARPGTGNASIRAVRITVNGRDLPVERLKAILRERRADDVVVFRAHVDFPPGRVNALVSAVAIDDFDLESLPARVTIARTTTDSDVKGTLYVLAVGVSQYQIDAYNLNYAHADAEALATTLRKQQGRAFANVEPRVLTDERATVANVKAALGWLRDSCTPADVAVVMFSGHGIRGRRGLYYVTHEGDLDALTTTCLNWTEIASTLDQLQAQAVLFFADCCHAGAFGDQTATQDELAESLVKQAGVMVFASSQGHEQSLERADWKHGAFTQAILTGLEGEADLQIGSAGPDGRITISELQAYVSARVAQMTDRRQNPYIPRLNRFDPLLVVALP